MAKTEQEDEALPQRSSDESDGNEQFADTQDVGTQDVGTQDVGTQDVGTQDVGTQDVGASTRVLVVDDERANAFAMQRLLTVMGHQACSESSAEAALRTLETFKPQVVLSDVMMPGMNGFDFARRVRETESSSPVYLVALTGSADPEDREEAITAGFNDYYVKPVGIEQLRRIIRLHAVHQND